MESNDQNNLINNLPPLEPPPQPNIPSQIPPTPKKLSSKIIAIIILAIIAGAVSYIALTKKPNTTNITPVAQTVKKQAYKNLLLGYEISYGKPWRIATNFSKKLAVLKRYSNYAEKSECYIDPNETDEQKAINFLNQCLSSKPDYQNFETEFKNFQLNWKPENSEVVVLTDLDETAEQTFVNQITSHEKTYLDFPAGYHFIQINPFDVVLSFQKETSPDSTRKIKLKFYSMPNGVQAFQSDSRLLDNKLSVNIPNHFGITLDNSKPAESLDVATNAPQNSQEEKEFYSVINSIKFAK
ncbi:MAG: hypothetical protein A3A83_02960 [Candidatus Doudnabacteria bacterium RIFCSPLOWO2_01_FULL_48_57]|nr:MAG: hypothetical protein A2668_01700 [Candidatus Doudnabacteria bacterium RIFCSPHIGHO2_01_FULL_48_180]OGE97118.1 MAG: hypothetical protein A3A83_02960 [Candidatus Doudnabacteria bacterium RIFCSPLOWO2_01_FULL_48_57]